MQVKDRERLQFSKITDALFGLICFAMIMFSHVAFYFSQQACEEI